MAGRFHHAPCANLEQIRAGKFRRELPAPAESAKVVTLLRFGTGLPSSLDGPVLPQRFERSLEFRRQRRLDRDDLFTDGMTPDAA
jgi:hypothetical protein